MAWAISGLGAEWNETAKFINQKVLIGTGSWYGRYRYLLNICFLSADRQRNLCPVWNDTDSHSVSMGYDLFKFFSKKADGVYKQTMSDTGWNDRRQRKTTGEYGNRNTLARITHRLERLYTIMQTNRRKTSEEKEELQALVSDISHQIKTPITNLKMINDTMQTQIMSEEKRQELLQASGSQLDKLDFLIQAMVKTSRLETGVIALEKKQAQFTETLTAVLNGILAPMEKKQIALSVNCPNRFSFPHDSRWTAEALYNILDNAMKYTPACGSIHVNVQEWEMYFKIDISDTGKGIPEKEQAAIFKRFYREDTVHDIDGIGIGLYLAREIVTMQGGYIKVVSDVGAGSTFSVFLPKK